ncbi:MAG: KpsF/GutQ family sugar-phosphate isomerase [Gammaproteobacteria bacterium]
MSDDALQRSGRFVLETEAAAVPALVKRVDGAFVAACRMLLGCSGRVVVTGMGKSGHIGSKMAATFASAGTPAFFVHPGEASHGDLGMVTPDDVVIGISNSGQTAELVTILPLIKRLGARLIAMTGNPQSRLARLADLHLDVAVELEACPLGLAPTASTTAALAMGDALAIALLEARGFGPEDFARSHPGGRLGRRLWLHIGDIMHAGDETPRVAPDTTISATLVEMSRPNLGIAVVVDAQDKVLGVFTDGDLRRVMETRTDVHESRIAEVMTTNCVTARADMLAAEALRIMQHKRVNALPVVDDEHRLIGAINTLDLLRAGVM